MYDLSHFKLRDMVECASVLREMGDGATSLGEVAERTVRYLYENLLDPDGKPSCALVRFFKTHRYCDLAPDLQMFVDGNLGRSLEDPTIPCLMLLGTAGDWPEWNHTHMSVRHRAIPLLSEQIVERFPMLSQLIKQLGLNISTVLRPDPEILVDLEQRTYNVFHVADAVGSSHIPTQESFVIPNGIKSVLGFGGILPAGELYAVILFSKVAIPSETARLFTTLALSVKVALVAVLDAPLFAVPNEP